MIYGLVWLLSAIHIIYRSFQLFLCLVVLLKNFLFALFFFNLIPWFLWVSLIYIESSLLKLILHYFFSLVRLLNLHVNSLSPISPVFILNTLLHTILLGWISNAFRHVFDQKLSHCQKIIAAVVFLLIDKLLR